VEAPRTESNLLAIEGIDTDAGLKRVAGNQRLYRNLLQQFVDKQSDVVPQIQAALKAGDGALAERLAHTVKGVAGNLGITGVQSAAGAVEKALRSGDTAVTALLAQLDSAVGTQVQAIRAVLAGPAPQTVVTELDSEKADAAVSRLKSLLEANDGDAAEAVNAVADILAGHADGQLLAELRAAVDEFDFDGAKAKLSRLRVPSGAEQ
jgi:HPt (histidine-containing phosphotransfer) domain-containing protein